MNKIIQGDTLKELKKLPNDLVDTIITSPPYWGLRDYGTAKWEGGSSNCEHKVGRATRTLTEKSKIQKGNKGSYADEHIPIGGLYPHCGAKRIDLQIGLEPTLEEYIEKLLKITAELKRVLKPTGVMFWNHGDCYGSHRDWTYSDISLKQKLGEGGKQRGIKGMEKCLMLQNYRLIIEMINQGWILRNTIIWHKPNHMPSSVKDRFANSYEPVFMLVKKKKYWFDLDAVRIPHTVCGVTDKRPMGILRQKLYPDSQYNESDDPHLKQFQTKIPKEQAEDFGTPRTRSHRKVDVTAEHFKKKGSGGNLNLPAENPKGKNPGDVWRISTQPFPEAHFATFPEKLIEPMILSSCPKEICKKCGKARVRISKVKIEEDRSKRKYKKGTVKNYMEGIKENRWKVINRQTLGWTDCKCGKGFEAGIVLDPFIGSGTVAVVAKRLGRNYLEIELSPDYIKIAEQRIRAQPTPLF